MKASQILLILILGVSLCLPYSVLAISQEGPEQNRSFIMERLVDLLDFISDLDLTDEQKTTLKGLISETRDTVKPLMDEMKELRAEMNKTILAESIDTHKASELNKKMVEIKSRISTIILNAKLDGAQVLTSEQRAMILVKKNEHSKRMEEWRECFQEWRDLFSKLSFN